MVSNNFFRLSSQVLKLEKGRVYTAGCLKEFTLLFNWSHPLSSSSEYQDDTPFDDIYSPLTSPNVMYVGDSLFAGKYHDD